MLVQYAVENYKSIKEEVVINFRAEEKGGKSSWTTSFHDKDSAFYKCIGLFGSNASGKSNILDSSHDCNPYTDMHMFIAYMNELKQKNT